jgi:hypothetical protein
VTAPVVGKVGGALVIIAGVILCFPAVGSTLPPSSARAAIAVRRTSIQPVRTISPTSPPTTATAELIPPLVIHPSVRVAASPARAPDPTLPTTGSSYLLLTSILGLWLVGAGLLLLFLQSLGSATKLAVQLDQIGRRMA